jgi:hypothetical protein
VGLDTILFLITIGLILAFLIYAITFQAWQARLRQPEPSARQKARLAISCVLFPLILLAGFLLAASSVFVVPILSVLALAVLPVALVIMAFAHLIPVIPADPAPQQAERHFWDRVFACHELKYVTRHLRILPILTAGPTWVMVQPLILDDDDTSNLLQQNRHRHDRDPFSHPGDDPAGDLRVRWRSKGWVRTIARQPADLAADPPCRLMHACVRLRSVEADWLKMLLGRSPCRPV